MKTDLREHRAILRRLMAEQSEFGISTPPPCFTQADFPLGSMMKQNRRRARKVIMMPASEGHAPSCPKIDSGQ